MDLKLISSTLRAALTAHRAISPRLPDFVSAFNFGLLLMRLQEFAPAADCFEKLLSLIPDNQRAQYYLANCYFSLKKMPDAKKLYEQITMENPGHLDALNNLGALLLHEGDTESALQCFSAILSTHPDHAEARNNIAATLLQLQRYAYAAEHYRLLLESNPQDLAARYSYALALLDSHQFEEAIAQFQQILQVHPTDGNALSNLGPSPSGATGKCDRQLFISCIDRRNTAGHGTPGVC